MYLLNHSVPPLSATARSPYYYPSAANCLYSQDAAVPAEGKGHYMRTPTAWAGRMGYATSVGQDAGRRAGHRQACVGSRMPTSARLVHWRMQLAPASLHALHTRQLVAARRQPPLLRAYHR